ncbi:MAG: protein-disulfide reductase DsbD [Endozoicomonadaceae bacterium]|nr:protein-disulfide reductase DsbD [Endozoicomonadaceae bacterium]
MYLHSYFLALFRIMLIIAMQMYSFSSINVSAVNHSPHFLPVHEAFQFSGKTNNKKAVVHIHLAKGYYLYKDRISFHATNKGTNIGSATFPLTVKTIIDPFQNKKMAILPASGDVTLPYTTKDLPALLQIKFQGCATGLCYPPSEVTLQLSEVLPHAEQFIAGNNFSAESQLQLADAAPRLQSAGAEVQPQQTSTNHYFNLLSGGQHNLIYLLAIFFLAGILLAFTPCVLPMIPILSATLAGTLNDRKRIILMTLTYIFFMALTYAVSGALVGVFGNALHLQTWFQSPWIVSLFALLFIILAGSMFGLYELQLPEKLRNKITSVDTTSAEKRRGSLVGAGVMGICSALIVSPCITAPLVGTLIYISSTQNGWFGGLILFALGLGMGVPLFIVGAGLGQYLPKSGVWMNKVKHAFGILMLGIALWLVSRLLSGDTTLSLWGIFILGVSAYLFLSVNWHAKASGKKLFTIIISVLLFIYSGCLIIGGLMGNSSFTKPLAFSNSTGAVDVKDMFITVTSPEQLKVVKAEAIKDHRPLFIDFYADWCETCQSLDKNVFSDPAIAKLLINYKAVRFDVTKTTKEQRKLMDTMRVFGTPTLIIYSPEGQEEWRHASSISLQALKTKLDGLS